ncbi:uncharacterized protein G2W53_008615 [Senna tora]|uniref:Uncharacterized protein n=1 Tax=Senna tora TaxID=362788 RepID=A0A834XAH4_9FABA|nr:uncharacterized protein G2W53_008615 [Senna tora]
MTLYKKVRIQNAQGRQTSVTPSTGSQDATWSSGSIKYAARQTPPETMQRKRMHETVHMYARPLLESGAGIDGRGEEKDKKREIYHVQKFVWQKGGLWPIMTRG